MREPGDDGTCWDGVDLKTLWSLSQVEMSTLEGLCLCPFRAGEQRVELPNCLW